ncbi:polysaccharide deacetylase family protein [Streptococcus sp. zg-86]|uniref:Polysaccharide deacetylase family protein n=1 Tax=Streptococcus zhangguiae TaxID=2664091 RepID=A0A6I4RIM4_9STRE|nr:MULTISPECIES: polysaccharide deacetylase family protein [unclassified Streptococcus]MTB64609.1 polysaccharide deacetylase family protein [Streptococcus sp. zg-86]MTB90919.1 polysaccharide deacetylase family protein [Streptococcus sp. zg-36]MWV56657.1 polysaccharide deacetylase family protein [Streptococcus sp. zg-70]QTH48616.1 polysaccharide deacetylase family protein [Streptococcus sp. zg-86]
MVAQRSRSRRRNGKRQQRRKNLWGIFLTLTAILAISLTLYLKRDWLFAGTTSTPSSTIQTSQTTKETLDSSSTNHDTATTADKENMVWEKQEAPVRIPILMYHAVHVMAAEEAANANLIVDPTTFESHLKALQEAGYYTLTPEEAYKILTENVLPKGKKVVWLTFDDSLWDFYRIAYPLLKQYNMTATNNVITGVTDTQPDHLTLEQIKEMKGMGMSFQSHTVNHPDLEYSTLEAQATELKDSKDYLDRQLDQDTITIAYPAGRYSEQTIKTVENNHYKLGVTTNEGLASAADGLLTLNRIRILPVTTADVLLQTIEQ